MMNRRRFLGADLGAAVAAPLVGPATVLGVAAAVLSVVWLPAAVACAWLAGWCAQAIAQVARLGAALPGATLPPFFDEMARRPTARRSPSRSCFIR